MGYDRSAGLITVEPIGVETVPGAYRRATRWTDVDDGLMMFP